MTAPRTTTTTTEFERQRGELVQEIAQSFEHVLASVNKLNRNLEAVIAVGNEFASVEALWSTFENVMGKPPPAPAPAPDEDGKDKGGGEGRAQQQQQQKTDEGRRSRTAGGGAGGGDSEEEEEEL